MFAYRMTKFRARLDRAGIDTGLITDEDNVYYLTGAQVGDSFIITDDGNEPLIHHPKDVADLIVT